MKNILIMRHAKSDWNTDNSDFDRPLNKRGKKAAPEMGKFLLAQNKKPDIIISSPAERAKNTAEFVKNELNFSKDIIFNKNFYFGNEDSMLNDLFALSDDVECVLLVGHNPTVENLVNKLTSEYQIMTTANVVSIFAKIEKWQDLKLFENKIEWAKAPKMIKNSSL